MAETAQSAAAVRPVAVRAPLGWALITVLVAAFVALYFSLQLGVFVLLFALVGWWAWGRPEETFWLLIILSPLLSMFKATQTIGTVTLIKDVLILVLCARTFLWPLLTRRLPYRRSILFAPIAVLTAWTFFAAVRADNLTLGILRAREIVLYLLLYFGVLYLDHSRTAWRQRLMWVVATFGVTSMLAVYQWFFAADSAVLRFDPGRSIWIPRISSTFAHPSVYGEYLVALAALWAALGVSMRRWWHWLLFAATLPLIFLTYSRAVWIGLLGAGGVMGIFWIWTMITAKARSSQGLDVALPSVQSASNSRSRSLASGEDRARFGLRNAPVVKRSFAALGAIMALILVTILLRFTAAGPLLRSAFDPTYKSNVARLEFAVRLIAPMSNVEALIGRGLGDVVEQKLLRTNVGVEEITVGASRDVQLAKDQTLVDNQYLKSFVELGLIGLVIYAWLFWRFLTASWELVRSSGGEVQRLRKVIGLWAVGFLSAFVIQGLFIDIWDVFPTNAMFWIVGGLLSAALTPYPAEK